MKSIRGYLRTLKLKRRLEKPPIIVCQHVEGVEIKFVVHNWIEYHNRARDSYTGEPETVLWIKENLKEGDVLWDIGANVGAYALLAAKMVSSASVVAFEPYIPTYSHLWDNIVLNECSNRITPFCLALSDNTRMETLGISDLRAGSSEHVLGGKHFDFIQASITMKADDVLTLLGLEPPNLIKIDVDGYEMHVLKGMENLLRNPLLRSLIVETNKGKTDKLVYDFLSALGFEKIDDSSVQTEQLVFNTIYRRKDCGKTPVEM